MLFSFIMWEWGHSSTHLFLNWTYWVSVGDTARGTMLPGLVEVIAHGSVCVWVGRGVDTHVLCTSLS